MLEIIERISITFNLKYLSRDYWTKGRRKYQTPARVSFYSLVWDRN